MSMALISQIAAAIAAILGMIKLWRTLTEKQHRVAMSVGITHDPAPPVLYYLNEVVGENLSHSVLMAASGILDRLVDADGVRFRDKCDEFASALLKRIPMDARTDRISRLIRVTLENKGKRTAKSVTVDFDFDPLFYRASTEDARKDRRSVRLAELRPGHKVTIEFWVGPFVLVDSVRATHEDHAIGGVKSYTAFGWRAVAAEYMLDLFVLIIAVLVIGLVISLAKSIVISW